MKLDVTAEQFRQVIETVEPSLYEKWEVDSVSITDDKTVIDLAVSGYADSSYLDFTPIFQLLSEANSTFGDQLWLHEVQFDSRSVAGTVTVTTVKPTADTVEPIAAPNPCRLLPSNFVDIDYDSPPLIVGYCNPAKLSIE